MGDTFSNLTYHIVFGTKGRKPWLDDTIRERVFQYIGRIDLRQAQRGN